MNAEETKTLHRSLCRRWPGKFSADDLGFWSAKLGSHSLADVEAALTKFKNTKRFVPKVDEVLALLPRYAVPASTPVKRDGGDDGFVAMVRRTHAWFKPTDGDAEVVLRYWRSLWFGYEPGAIQRIEQVMSSRGRVADEIVDDAVRDTQARYEVTKRSMFRRCVMTLIGLNVDGRGVIDETRAAQMADYIFAPPEMFRVCLADVRGDPFG